MQWDAGIGLPWRIQGQLKFWDFGFSAESGFSTGENWESLGNGKGLEALVLCRGWMGMNSIVFMEHDSSGMSIAMGLHSLGHG